jgi:hypothetical protein
MAGILLSNRARLWELKVYSQWERSSSMLIDKTDHIQGRKEAHFLTVPHWDETMESRWVALAKSSRSLNKSRVLVIADHM